MKLISDSWRFHTLNDRDASDVQCRPREGTIPYSRNINKINGQSEKVSETNNQNHTESEVLSNTKTNGTAEKVEYL